MSRAAGVLSGRLSPGWRAALAITLAIVAANGPSLLGIVDANPLGPAAQLVAAQTPGPLPGLPSLDPNNGVISQALGHRAALDWLSLHPPWWNPDSATGVPLAGEMQSAALFAPTLLTLLGNGLLYEHMLLEFLAGLFTYLLARRLGLGQIASTGAGIVYALNGTFAWFGHAPVNPVAFAPALLLGIEHAAGAAIARRPGGWWLIAVAGALSVYAGFPEVAFIDAVLALGWVIWRASTLAGRARMALPVKAGVGALAGALMAAPLLVAFGGYLGHADVGIHTGSRASAVTIAPHGLVQFVLPYAYGPLFDRPDPNWGVLGGYLGAGLLLLALIGAAGPGRRGLRGLLVIAIALTAARMYGVAGLGDVLGLVPQMSRVEFARYAFPALELAVALLAALGLQTVADARLGARRAAGAGGVGVLALAVAGATGIGVADRFGAGGYLRTSLIWAVAVGLAAAAVLAIRTPRTRAVALAALAALDAAVMFAVPELSAPRAVRVDTRTEAYLKAHLGLGRYVTVGPFGPNYGAYFGVRSLNLSDGMAPDGYARLVRTQLDPAVAPTLFVGRPDAGALVFAPATAVQFMRHVAAYRQAAVGYIVTRATAAPPSSATLTLVSSSPEARVYRLAGAHPYFTAPGCAIVATGATQVGVNCRRRAVLVRRETALPGWSASLDGRPTALHIASGVYQSLIVPPGSHRVSFDYMPPGLGWGLLGLAAGVGATLLGATRARQARGDSSAHGTITASS